MKRYPYKLIAIFPNATETAFRQIVKSFIPRNDPLPTKLEGLAGNPNPNTPQTHLLISYNLNETMFENFYSQEEIAFFHWAMFDSSNHTIINVSSGLSGIAPPNGSYWSLDSFLSGSNFYRKRNCEL